MLIIANFVQSRTSSILGAKVANLLRFKIYQKIEQHSFDEKNESDVLSRFSTDIAFLENVIFYILPFSILYSAMIIIGLSILVYFNWKLTLLIVIIMPITLLLPRSFSKLTTNLLTLKKQSENGILSSIQERILMSDIIRLFRLKQFKRNQFNEKLIENEKISYNYSLRSGLASRTTYLGVNLTRFLVFAIGAYLVIINKLSVGELIGFIILLGSVNASISGLANLYPQLNRAEASLKNIEELIGPETSIRTMETKIPLAFSREISYQNIEFKIGDRNILSGVNIKIHAGEFVAFVGPSGSGKSTLIKLLLKDASPTSGKITFDDNDLQLISTSSLLSQIGVVTQQPKLFELSVMENIRMGKLNALDDEIIIAAQKAEIHQDILKFSHQYDTVIHKNETGISGGQVQRITIARALINHPRILCLDEATSALDPINGAAIDDMIARLSRHNTNAHTIISVTHRLKSIAHADTIFVLENGKIIESGKHEELLKNKGL
ncbi:ABC transporter ATP-binding protein, partial [Legionella tunisiensis]|uniref:ABC transporter ATP-binding protein n=1 Tax=Legionella tunisiensis TaxID=1034944 RepID=UPI000362D22E